MLDCYCFSVSPGKGLQNYPSEDRVPATHSECHQASSCSSCCSKSWLHSKSLLSHKPSMISRSRISLKHNLSAPPKAPATKSTSLLTLNMSHLETTSVKRGTSLTNGQGVQETQGEQAPLHHSMGRKAYSITQGSQKPLRGLRVPVHSCQSAQFLGTHLDSYLDSVFSSHAVLPPPKFFLAVLAIPCGGEVTGSGVRCEPR